MNFKLVCAMALGAALLATGPAQAAKCTKDTDCSVGQVCSLGTCKARSSSDTARGTAASSNARIAWGDIGYYNVGFGFNSPFFFGTQTANFGAFGINVGTAVNVLQLSNEVPLALWGNVAIAFPSPSTVFPLTAGAALRYDKLPVALLGGLGLTLMPNSTLFGASGLPAGLAFQGMGFLPLPQVSPNFSANLQLSYHILSSSYSLFAMTVGGSFTY